MAYAAFAPRLSTSPPGPYNDTLVQTVTGAVANLMIRTGDFRAYRVVRDADGQELLCGTTQAQAAAFAAELVAAGVV